MFGLFDAWTFVVQHPLIGLAAFLAVGAGVIAWLSGGKLTDSLRGILRVFVTIFTTPFLFLRDALTIVRSSGETDLDYRRSRTFMLFRLSRIQYMGLLVMSVLVLSSGITSSLISLYPAAEIERGKAINQEVTRLQKELAAVSAAAAAGTPAQMKALAAKREQTQAAYQQTLQANAALLDSTSFRGPLINQLSAAQTPEAVASVRDSIDGYMAACPRGYEWYGFNAEACKQYRAFVEDLARRKAEEARLARAAEEAEAAWSTAGTAAETAQSQQVTIQESLAFYQQQQKDSSLLNPRLIGAHLLRALLSLLGTFASVIAMVWFGAIAISVLSWIILMMRSLELSQGEELRRRSPLSREE